MSEKLGIDSSFGYCAAVYGNIFGMLTCAVSMYNLREEFFAGSAFARYEYRQVDRRYPNGTLNGGT